MVSPMVSVTPIDTLSVDLSISDTVSSSILLPVYVSFIFSIDPVAIISVDPVSISPVGILSPNDIELDEP